MAIDFDAALAFHFDDFDVQIERGRLQFFADVIGETKDYYRDVAAARECGYPDIPVPLTYFFSLGMARPMPFGYLAELGVDMADVLHGEQSFDYHTPAFAGDVLRLSDSIVDAYKKRGGALQFLVKRTEIKRGDELVAEARSVVIVRDSEVDSDGD